MDWWTWKQYQIIGIIIFVSVVSLYLLFLYGLAKLLPIIEKAYIKFVNRK